MLFIEVTKVLEVHQGWCEYYSEIKVDHW